jgi:hypothetical protein
VKRLLAAFFAWGPDAFGSTRALGLLRIAFAALAWSVWAEPYRLFESSGALQMCLGCVFMVSSSLMFAGLWSRTSAAVTGFAAFHLIYTRGIIPGVIGHASNNHYLLATGITLLALAPCGRSLSLDRLLALRHAERAGLQPPDETGPLWVQRLLYIQLSAVYLWATQMRMTAGFLSGERVQHMWLTFYSGADLPEHALFAPLCQAIAIFTVLLEPALGIGLYFRRPRPWLMAAGILFHGVLYWMLEVGSFSLITLAFYICFIPPEATHRFIGRFAGGADTSR